MPLLLFSCGVLSSAFWPLLPEMPLLVALLVTALPLTIHPRFRPILFVLLGIAWASIWGHWSLHHRLSTELDKTDYLVTGTVQDMPRLDPLRSSFYLDVHRLQALQQGVSAPKLKRLRLSWYQSPSLEPGQLWHLRVRLRAPRGLSNPGGFDYTAWLLSEGVSATGYVRAAPTNSLLDSNTGMSIAGLRFHLQQSIGKLALSEGGKGFIAALTIGDKQFIPAAMWRTLEVTGTLHLMVVSGLHIGILAGCGWLLGIGVGRLLAAAGATLPATQIGAGLSLVVALGYSLLAGFSLPTQRAVIMLAVFLIGPLLRRKIAPGTGLLWALAIVSTLDPLAALSPGFWLSFTAVAGLVAYFKPRPRLTWLRRMLLAQGVVFFSLAGWLLLYQGEINFMTPLINLLAIPWISIAVVPLCLLGGILLPFHEAAAHSCWMLAGYQLEWFAQGLEWVARVANASRFSVPSDDGGMGVAAFVFAGVVLLLPRGLGWQAPGWVLLAALFWLMPQMRPALAVTVLDVGQGLAVVVQTPEQVLVYDTGPKFSERFDAGSGIVAPFLRHSGVASIDLLVISHNDSDHAGGAAGLFRYYRPLQTIAPGGSPELFATQPCAAGQHWAWRDLKIDILHPGLVPEKNDNNQSCVLLLRYRTVSVLLTGDVEVAVESALLQKQAWPRDVTLLIAPHHGSKTSSSVGFVQAVHPRHVVFSAGYRHHFGHPHGSVVARYQQSGAELWSTAESGALRFVWDEALALTIWAQREVVQRYWH